MQPISLRHRLSRSLLTGWLVWSLAILGSLWWVIDHEIEELLDETLIESAQIIANLVSDNAKGTNHEGAETRTLPFTDHDERLIWQLTDLSGRVLLGSHQAPATSLNATNQVGLSDDGSGKWRVYSISLPGTEASMLHVGQDSEERREAAFEAAQYTAATALCIGLLVMLWTRTRLSRELAPLSAFSELIRDYDPLAPESYLPPASHAELQPVRNAIESLASRLAQRVENERAFSAHAAHALRTPLAGLDAQLAVAQREAPVQIQPRLAQARQAAGRLQRVVTALLALFRSGSTLRSQRFRVADVTSALSFAELDVAVTGSEFFEGDPDLIAAALMNLIDNSVRHRASCVSLQFTPQPNPAITIQDNGQGIPQSRMEQLNRALKVRDYTDNMGLGLMLADMVARLHGGRLEIHAARSGCRITLHLSQPGTALT